ncbi:hypothetical protein [Dysgonomonas sp. Marseille-P4361]|uniref:hypothetical protein n=1 Tax=Dysgonomonas sp. Marseille-P4361 TaxID=2161820 RepID=UPI00135CCD05|nr:hypothetical protein [Dysgonomonas sp. Marseille-P4361]
MRTRYFSHYVYIEPDILLKNYIVEMDEEHHITDVFPFEKEIERTEFYSGILLFVGVNIAFTEISLDKIKELTLKQEYVEISSNKKYKMFHIEDFIK